MTAWVCIETTCIETSSSFLVLRKGAITKWRNTKDWKDTEQCTHHTTTPFHIKSHILSTNFAFSRILHNISVNSWIPGKHSLATYLCLSQVSFENYQSNIVCLLLFLLFLSRPVQPLETPWCFTITKVSSGKIRKVLWYSVEEETVFHLELI